MRTQQLALNTRGQGWYSQVTVPITAAVITEPIKIKVRWLLHLLSLLLGTDPANAMLIAFTDLPDPFPAHYDLAGNVDSYDPGTWGAVLLIPGLATAGQC